MNTKGKGSGLPEFASLSKCADEGTLSPRSYPPFSQQLRAARELNGATQAEVARAAKVHVTAVAHMEAGRREPSLVVLRRLAVALGIQADFLLGLASPRAPPGTPTADWLIEFAQRWSSGKDDDAIKALAWNINGAFSEWREEAARASGLASPQGNSGREENLKINEAYPR